MTNYKFIYKINNPSNILAILGASDRYIKAISTRFNISLNVDGSDIYLHCYDEKSNLIEERVVNIFKALEMLIENEIEISEQDFYSILNNVDNNNYKSIINIYLQKEIVYSLYNGKSIYPKTLNQKLYLNALDNNDIVFALGPAGTGKTFLAVMYALKCLKKSAMKKIVLVRPVVEAGEKLGFLPGDLKEKIDPYLIPIYDALYDAIGKETVTKYIEKGTIEVAPLAYMRGRTLENAIIILDEAQNTTLSQMKMFLTRLGFYSKMIITGDVTQIDLPSRTMSGLIEATNILEDIDGIKIVRFQKDDVMRHPLVFKIIEKYENR